MTSGQGDGQSADDPAFEHPAFEDSADVAIAAAVGASTRPDSGTDDEAGEARDPGPATVMDATSDDGADEDGLDTERRPMPSGPLARLDLGPLLHRPTAAGQAWMLTFADLISLLLTFFVMLFAMSSVKSDLWEKMVASVSRSLNPTIEATPPDAAPERAITRAPRRPGTDIDYLGGVIARAIANDPGLQGARLHSLDDRLVLSLPAELLFAPNRTELSERALVAVRTLGDLVSNLSNGIGIIGHSDPAPPQSGTYTSNWELSVVRAASVARALRQGGYPHPVVAYGVGDSRYGELSPLPAGERDRVARRVDIMILPSAAGR